MSKDKVAELAKLREQRSRAADRARRLASEEARLVGQLKSGTTIAEYCRREGCSPRTVWNKIRRGELRAVTTVTGEGKGRRQRTLILPP